MAEKHRIRKREIRVRVTDEEHEVFFKKAREKNLTMSDYVRKIIMEGVIIVYQPFDMKEATRRFHEIGCNINQVAKSINERNGEYNRKDIDMVIEEIRKMQDVVHDIMTSEPNHIIVY